MIMNYDFCGYATKCNIKCSDGRIIQPNAFKDNDGSVVPLVWQHQHDSPFNVLGHALLENRTDGVYAYCTLNDTEPGLHAKSLVEHGDVTSMSIFANRLREQNGHVMHGTIREVSLVLAGANPEAYIEDHNIVHSDGSTVELSDDEKVIYFDSPINTRGDKYDADHIYVEHADSKKDENNQNGSNNMDEKEKIDNDETIQDVVDSMTDKQKNVMYYLIGQVVDEYSDDSDDDEEVTHSEGDDASMKFNIFEQNGEMGDENTISHDAMQEYVADAKRGSGSLKEAFLQHGIEEIDILFPEAKAISPTPDLITRQMSWVSEVWNALKKSPFARIKSVAANLTEDDARALGYIKGKKKKEEVIKLLKRVTTPQTVYKLQKLDRDDIIDATELDVVAWLKAEMRMMLDEELARAVLVGDGRSAASEDKIQETNIRPIYQDDDLYTIHTEVTIPSDADSTDASNAFITQALRARKNYMGSGNPAFYASTDVINDMLLATDKIGRRLYNTLDELASALRVSKIVEVPILEGATRTDSETSKKYELLGLIVNLSDYTIGADKGGAVSLFDDFDINYNKYEYLIETRCSGTLTKPYSAIALEKAATSTSTKPEDSEKPENGEVAQG